MYVSQWRIGIRWVDLFFHCFLIMSIFQNCLGALGDFLTLPWCPLKIFIIALVPWCFVIMSKAKLPCPFQAVISGLTMSVGKTNLVIAVHVLNSPYIMYNVDNSTVVYTFYKLNSSNVLGSVLGSLHTCTCTVQRVRIHVLYVHYMWYKYWVEWEEYYRKVKFRLFHFMRPKLSEMEQCKCYRAIIFFQFHELKPLNICFI